MDRLARFVALGTTLIAVAGWVGRPVIVAPAGEATQTAEETIVKGSVPDLTGRWLAVTTIELPTQKRMLAAFLEVTPGAEGPSVHEAFVTLPPALKAEMDAATAQSTEWEATDYDLREVAKAWNDLPKEDRFIDRARHEVLGPDAFDDMIKKEGRFAGARWMLRQEYGFLPGTSRPVRQLTFYSPTVEEKWGWAGAFVTVMVAAAPFPVPITFEGHFKLHRLPVVDEPKRSWWRLW